MKAWENNIRQVEPYTAGEQPQFENMIKLNTNENPYPPCKGVLEGLKCFDGTRLCLYPDTSSKVLVSELARYHDVKEDAIFVGVGSDEVLALSFLTFFNSKKPILFPNITYSFYDVWAKLYQIPFEQVPLDESFRIKKEDYMKENGGIVIANPNAPTSIAESPDFFEEIISRNQDCVVIIDEAYIDFGGETCLSLIKKYENVLVVRTFSKSRSMAGMRIGYAMGNKGLIMALNDVKESFNSYTMNMVSMQLGAESVKDEEYFQENLQKIITTRETAKENLRSLGFTFPDSKTNFLFVSSPVTQE